MAKQYTASEILSFYEREIKPTLIALTTSQYRLPEIQAHWMRCCAEMTERFGVGPMIMPYNNPANDSAGSGKSLPSACRLLNGVAEVALFLPTIMESFDEFVGTCPSCFKAVFEAFLVVTIMHETDHLALGICGPVNGLQAIIDGETTVWARTCATILCVLADTYRFPLCRSNHLFYSAWVASGRGADMGQFRRFVASSYGTLKGKR
jgi:hypothetical protein